MSCKSGPDLVGSAHLHLKTHLRACAASFTRCLMLDLPYSVSLALLLGPELISADLFSQCWVHRQDLGAPSHAAFCSLVTRDTSVMRMHQARPHTSCPLSQELSSCFSAWLRSILPRSLGSGMGSGIALCSADTLGMKLRVRKELHLTSFLESQPHFTPQGGVSLHEDHFTQCQH